MKISSSPKGYSGMFTLHLYLCFPITNPLSPLQNLWSLFNRCSIGYLTSLVTFSCMFSVFFRSAKMFLKLSALLFVFLDVMIYPFMADLNAVKFFELGRDLFRSPIFFQSIINDLPFSSAYSWLGFVLSSHRFAMGLFWAVTTLALITANFTTYGRFMYTHQLGNSRLTASHFQNCINKVSLFIGKLFVTHKRSFTSGKWKGPYFTSAYLSTTSFVALTS